MIKVPLAEETKRHDQKTCHQFGAMNPFCDWLGLVSEVLAGVENTVLYERASGKAKPLWVRDLFRHHMILSQLWTAWTSKCLIL